MLLCDTQLHVRIATTVHTWQGSCKSSQGLQQATTHYLAKFHYVTVLLKTLCIACQIRIIIESKLTIILISQHIELSIMYLYFLIHKCYECCVAKLVR